MKVAFDQFRTLVSSPQITEQILFQFFLVQGSFFSDCIGLDVLVQPFVWIEVRTVGRQQKQIDPAPICFDPSFYLRCLVNRMPIKNKKDFSLHGFHETFEKSQKNIRIEFVLEDHESKRATVGDR